MVHGCTSEVALVPARELLRPFAKNAEDHIFSQLAAIFKGLVVYRHQTNIKPYTTCFAPLSRKLKDLKARFK
mgnify:FL=1